ncbi:hypothetical protein D030_1697B, partial [Vibrio parahaemolyticus AQ3810]
TNIMLFMI